MGGISQLLETARRAMMAQQTGLAITGHNIANASTTGYTRQTAEFIATLPVRESSSLIGTGVMVAGVARIRDQFLDSQIRSNNQTLSMATSEQEILSQVEATFNEPSDASLNTAITDFFNSWQDLSTNPQDSVTRNSVLQQGTVLSQTFQRLDSGLTSVRSSLKDDITNKITKINSLAYEISSLNVQIGSAHATGADYNDAKDQRDLDLDELSKLANISVSQDSQGSVMVSLGGTAIASKAGATTLKVTAGTSATVGGSSFDQLTVVTAAGGGAVDVSGGELGGVLKSYNSTIPQYLGQLDQLAQNIISSVNAFHAAGYGSGTPPTTGVNFFKGTDAATIAIDLTDTSGGAAPGSAASINNIAAAAGPPPPAAGDNTVALQIAGLISTPQTALGGSSASDFYNNLVTGIGSAVNTASDTAGTSQLVLNQLTGQRDSISGVSLDEEMANMIKFQRSYDAAAKLIQQSDEMFQTILNMV